MKFWLSRYLPSGRPTSVHPLHVIWPQWYANSDWLFSCNDRALLTKCPRHTAISREVRKKCAPDNLESEYGIWSVHCSCRTYFCCFPLNDCIQSACNLTVNIFMDIHVMVNWQLSKRPSTDQCHLTVSRAQVHKSLRWRVLTF